MNRRTLPLLVLLTTLLLPTARADVTVLVHGWHTNADTWLYSGVVAAMSQHGWRDQGVVITTPNGAALIPAPTSPSPLRLYRAHLAAEAPLQLQASQLFAELQLIRRRHPGESIALVGHSSGGLVARLVVVHPQAPKVNALITIATPNLGTVRAAEGLDVVDSKPFFCPGPGIDFMKSLIGGDDYDYLKHSRGALIDMTPTTPGSLTDWLNHQPHPDIAYHAVVRAGPVGNGDSLVPAISQDLNQVPALRGRAQLHLTPTDHPLNPADGQLLATLLQHS